MSFEKGPAGFVELVARNRKAFVCESPLFFLGEYRYADLATAACPGEPSSAEAGPDPAGGFRLPADFFADPKQRLFLASGWQSWSFAGELTWRERPRRAMVKKALNCFVDHPAEAELRALSKREGRRPDIVSHFFAVLREKDTRLGLVSTVWAGGRRPGPPLSFLLGSKGLRLYAYAEGGSFGEGETLARVALVPAADYFQLKDGFAAIAAGDAGRFQSLSGLCDLESRRPRLGGFETWYNRYLNIDKKTVLADLEAFGAARGIVGAALGAGKPAVFQIDDGWERQVGDWRPDSAKFPEGMAKLARTIAAKGFVPGIWLAPFLVLPGSPVAIEHPAWILRDDAGAPVSAGWNPGWGGEVHCLDLSIPEVEDCLVELFRSIVQDWGFQFLKLDFLYAGMLRGRRRGFPGGAWEHYARVLSRIAAIKTASCEATQATGPADGPATSLSRPKVAILSCGAPFESTAPIAPLMRVGADTKEIWDWTVLRLIGHQGRPSAKINISHSLARSLLDRTFLLSDPDVVFSRTENIRLEDNQKFLVGLVAWMFASQIMTSDAPSGSPEGAAPRGSLSQHDFEAELSSLYGKLGGRDFAVERFALSSPDIYNFRSKDGEIHGAINLSSRTEALALESPTGEAKPAVLPAKSLILFGLEKSGR
ncbi:MAG: alpha-galactosidase [Spirochaetes bacterium]|nr:alpha-galactosidase [Spirochaetota bacterium]